MINNIFLFLLNIKNKFFLKNKYNKINKNITLSNYNSTQSKKTNNKPLIKKEVNTTQYKKTNNKSLDKKDKKIIINKDHLLIIIKRNLFFLEELILSLSNNNDYINYYEKILDLKHQSESSYKVLIRLTEDKPYYKSTIILIYEHTQEISKLRN